MKPILSDPAKIILRSDGKQLVPVKQLAVYPSQFPNLLTAMYQGKSVGEVAAILNIAPEHLVKLLAGEWKPTKGICRKMGLKLAYVLNETTISSA